MAAITFSWALTRYMYIKLLIAHAQGMLVTFSQPLTSNESASERSRHASRHVRHARPVMHVGTANPRWWGKHSRRCATRNFTYLAKAHVYGSINGLPLSRTVCPANCAQCEPEAGEMVCVFGGCKPGYLMNRRRSCVGKYLDLDLM